MKHSRSNGNISNGGKKIVKPADLNSSKNQNSINNKNSSQKQNSIPTPLSNLEKHQIKEEDKLRAINNNKTTPQQISNSPKQNETPSKNTPINTTMQGTELKQGLTEDKISMVSGNSKLEKTGIDNNSALENNVDMSINNMRFSNAKDSPMNNKNLAQPSGNTFSITDIFNANAKLIDNPNVNQNMESGNFGNPQENKKSQESINNNLKKSESKDENYEDEQLKNERILREGLSSKKEKEKENYQSKKSKTNKSKEFSDNQDKEIESKKQKSAKTKSNKLTEKSEKEKSLSQSKKIKESKDKNDTSNNKSENEGDDVLSLKDVLNYVDISQSKTTSKQVDTDNKKQKQKSKGKGKDVAGSYSDSEHKSRGYNSRNPEKNSLFDDYEEEEDSVKRKKKKKDEDDEEEEEEEEGEYEEEEDEK